MHARRNVVLGSAYSAFAVYIATIAALSVPLRAQQADTTAVSATARPVEVQTKLAKQQAELNAAQFSADGDAELRALNGTGDVYWGVSEYQTVLDAYNRAVPLTAPPNIHNRKLPR